MGGGQRSLPGDTHRQRLGVQVEVRFESKSEPALAEAFSYFIREVHDYSVVLKQ